MAKQRITQNEVATVDLLVHYAITQQESECEILPCFNIDELPEGLGALANYGMELHLLGIIKEWGEMKKQLKAQSK